MRDAEFRAMLQASKERNRHNGYSHTDTPTSYEVPAFSKTERKNIEAVIRSITPRDRFMPVRKTTKNNLKTFLMGFDSYEELSSRLEDVIIGFCRSEGHPKYNKKLFYLLKNLDEISSSTVTSHLQRQATRLREGANKRGNSSRLTQSFHFFMFEPIFSPVNALNQPI
ncbi:hypothetical protein SDC80_005099 [Escherichia coli]|nr:hypothetical protein [Escherichia coli]